jgi:hypothetical protein
MKVYMNRSSEEQKLYYAVKGIQNREHITISYPETVRFSSNKWGLLGERDEFMT